MFHIRGPPGVVVWAIQVPSRCVGRGRPRSSSDGESNYGKLVDLQGHFSSVFMLTSSWPHAGLYWPDAGPVLWPHAGLMPA
ncbi:hypothetical protein PoB_004292000 [Plakobranchus ocellatus]|uniref:Uncharacterized protein n=1 Tax=Plakobranchus ocellatus TaxID=259542 RepID=A0AAV4BA76_9GAST|nr:hypothetical protein PoB_004292000 [Plakobranchus ocellatus]